MKKAFFLDRDGVINKDHGYVYQWDNFEVFENTYEALRLIKHHEYLIVIITNQAGIARGYYTESDFKKLMNLFLKEANSNGVAIDGVYHCPHHPQGIVSGLNIECGCRKPHPGMIHRAASDLGIDLHASYLVGDKLSDVQAGIASKLKESLLIDKVPHELAKNFPDLYSAVRYALRMGSRQN